MDKLMEAEILNAADEKAAKEVQKTMTIEVAAKELKMIVSSRSLRNRLDSYEKFFGNQRYKDILYEPEFLYQVCVLLAKTHLKREVYEIFVDAYHFREYNPEKLKPDAARLYQILDGHCKMKKKKTNMGYYVLVVLLLIMRTLTHTNREWAGAGVVIIVPAAILYYAYGRLLRRFTRWQIHMGYSLLILVSQFVLIMTDGYVSIMGNRTGADVLGGLLLIFGCAYFVGTVLLWLAYSLYWLIKENR